MKTCPIPRLLNRRTGDPHYHWTKKWGAGHPLMIILGPLSRYWTSGARSHDGAIGPRHQPRLAPASVARPPADPNRRGMPGRSGPGRDRADRGRRADSPIPDRFSSPRENRIDTGSATPAPIRGPPPTLMGSAHVRSVVQCQSGLGALDGRIELVQRRRRHAAVALTDRSPNSCRRPTFSNTSFAA